MEQVSSIDSSKLQALDAVVQLYKDQKANNLKDYNEKIEQLLTIIHKFLQQDGNK